MHTPFGPGCPWYGLYEKYGAANVKWCEATLCTWTNEPANAWSNMGYILLSFYLYWLGRKDRNPHVMAFGLIIFVLGVTSFFFHSSNNYFSQVADFIGMFFYVFLLLMFNLRRLGAVSSKVGWWIYAGCVAGASVLIPIMARAGIPYQLIVFLTGVGIVVTESMIIVKKKEPGVSYRPFVTAILFFVAGASFSVMDVKRIICDPDNHFFQAHATWHMLSAIGIYFSFRFYSRLPIMNSSRTG